MRCFGFTKSERIDFNGFLQRLHSEDREAVNQAVTRALAGEGSYEREYRLVLPDGRSRWIASRGQVEFNGDGKPVLIRGVSLDITARKQAELEVQQQRSELAHLSRVTMLGELSGSLAHELNQPLTAILSNAQAALRFLAHENADLNEVREILTDIVNEDKRAGEVIRRLRLLLKKGEVQHQPLDVNEVVLEVLKLVRSDLVNQGVTTHTELAPDLPVLHGDRVQLQQVLLNLVMNACDAMATTARDDRQIILRTDVAGDGAVRISVADCGDGIAPDKLEQVFEPFFTIQAPRHGPWPGRMPDDHHGARREVVGQQQPGARRDLSFHPDLRQSSVPMNHPTPTVFVVDDDSAVLKSLTRLLRSAGLTVATFSSPAEFLDRHDPMLPGCLVLDVAMPGLNGLELQQALRADGHDRCIVFLTGHGDIPMSVQAMKSGAVDFLTKPVNDDDLLKAIRAAIEKDRIDRQNRDEVAEIEQLLATLTPREREVLEHVISGQLNKQTAADLGTVEKTIKVHRARVMEKLKVESVAELVRLTERAGIRAK